MKSKSLLLLFLFLVLEQRSDSFVAEERRERGEEEEMKRGGRRPGSGSPGGRLPDDEAFSYLLSLCFFFLCSLFSPEASVSFHDDDGYALRASFEFFFRKKFVFKFFCFFFCENKETFTSATLQLHLFGTRRPPDFFFSLKMIFL